MKYLPKTATSPGICGICNRDFQEGVMNYAITAEEIVEVIAALDIAVAVHGATGDTIMARHYRDLRVQMQMREPIIQALATPPHLERGWQPD